MYVDLFSDLLVRKKDIVGIFDLDNTTTNRYTNDFLAKKQDEGKLSWRMSDLPESFVLLSDGRVIVSELSSRILKKRFDLTYKDEEN